MHSRSTKSPEYCRVESIEKLEGDDIAIGGMMECFSLVTIVVSSLCFQRDDAVHIEGNGQVSIIVNARASNRSDPVFIILLHRSETITQSNSSLGLPCLRIEVLQSFGFSI